MVKIVQSSAGDCFQAVQAVSQVIQSGTRGTGWQGAGKAEAAGGMHRGQGKNCKLAARRSIVSSQDDLHSSLELPVWQRPDQGSHHSFIWSLQIPQAGGYELTIGQSSN